MGVGEKRLAEARLHARGLSGAACRSWVEGVGEWTGRSYGSAKGHYEDGYLHKWGGICLGLREWSAWEGFLMMESSYSALGRGLEC